MSRRLPHTPSSRIRQCLRVLWLRSRERAEALKNTGYTCCICHVKQSTAKGREVKLVVHHMDGIDWEGLIDLIRTRLLQTPARLAPLCECCHKKMHPKLEEVEK